MLKNGEGGGRWLGEYSLDLIGIRAALWQAANTYSKGSARQSEWRVNAIGQGKGKKRKEEKDGGNWKSALLARSS